MADTVRNLGPAVQLDTIIKKFTIVYGNVKSFDLFLWDKVGQAKVGPPKAKVAAATIPPTREDELAQQLKYQQHQIDTLVGQVKNLVSTLKIDAGTT